MLRVPSKGLEAERFPVSVPGRGRGEDQGSLQGRAPSPPWRTGYGGGNRSKSQVKEGAQRQQAPRARGLWVIDPGPPQTKGIVGKGPGCRGGEGEKGNTPQGPVGKGPRESCGKRAQVPRGLWVRGAERCGGAGKRPGRGEKTGAHRRELWVAAPHPMRPLSHTHPPRGALLGLATVRGLAAAAAAPQQQGLLLWLRLRRRPRPSASVARPARAPGRCSRARAASAGDSGKGWNK